MKFEKLDKIAQIIAGQSPPSTTYNRDGIGLPFFQGKADFGVKYPTVRIWCSEPHKISLKNDILISVRAPVGSVNINNTQACIGRGLSAIRAKNDNNFEYLYYFLRWNEGIIEKMGVGSTFKSITQKDLSNLQIPLPETLTDQIKIAQILTQAEKLIAQRKESIALLDEFLKSTFLEMFGDPVRNEKGWEVKRLKNICNKITDGTHFSPPIKEEGVPYITAKHVRENKIDFFRNPWYISMQDHREIYKRCDPKKGDVLYIKDGATTGYAAINNYDFEFSMLSSLALLRTNNNLCIPEYLCSWLNNTIVKSGILKGMAGGAIQRLTLSKINELHINLPPLPLQNQFAQIVEKTEVLKSRYEHSLRELEQLFGSLSQRAFKGELDLSRMEVSEAAYNISDTSPSPTPLKPEKTKKERPQVAVKADTETSIWLSNRNKGKTGKVPFTPVEGNAVLTEFFNQGKGFHFQAFETFLKKEGFVYEFEQVKDFLFEKLEQQELLQYYSNVEWMEERYRQEIGSDEDDFSSDGRIWLVVKNKVVP